MMLVAVALLVASPSALAGEQGKTCDVERTCENTENGYRCIIKAKGETDVAAVRECVRSCTTKDSMPEGVTVTIEDTEGGAVVTCSSDDPELVKEMHLATSACTKEAGQSCCAKGEAHAACKKDCDHAAGTMCCSKKASTYRSCS
jgi:hypothetical protein